MKLNQKKQQSQDLIIAMHVFNQIKCFQYQIKAGVFRILEMQLTLKKIEMMDFYVKIEMIYMKL